MVEQKDVVNTYIEKQQEKWLKWQITSFLKSIWIDKKINLPFWWWKKIEEYVDLYLNNWSEDNKEVDKSFNIRDWIEWQIWWLKWWVQLVILETQLSLTCPYFSELKELLDIIKNDRIELNKLKENIEAGLAFDAVDGSKNEDVEKNPSNEKLSYWWYEKLKVLDEPNIKITQDDIDYVSNNANYVIENLKIKWELAKIKNIKDKDWNEVLNCTWATPFVNKKAAEDLVWFALLFYKKTGKTFSLSSAYRTMSHQEHLLKENANKWYVNPQGKRIKWVPTSNPWYSGHNLWYSIDINNPSGSSSNIGGVSWLQKIAKMFDFNPISSEDWHFDHQIFVDNYYNDKEARPIIAENLENSFNSNRAA